MCTDLGVKKTVNGAGSPRGAGPTQAEYVYKGC